MPTLRVDFKHVRTNASFEIVAKHYDLALIGKGDQRAALCPFHEEHTPSLKINIAKNIFNCFGCGAHGNILDFVTLMEGGKPEEDSDLRAGAFTLATICGIAPMPSGSAAPGKTKSLVVAKASRAIEETKPPAAPVAKDASVNKPLSFTLKLDATHPFLKERDLSTGAIEMFALGVADRGLMKGRLAIPIHNGDGNLVAYAGRWAAQVTPKGVPKYLLPEGFNKQIELFNLHRIADGTEQVIMVESYFSVFKLHELGIPVVSPMGHSISERQCQLLEDKGIKQVILLFDGDEAGQTGFAHGLPLLAQHFFVHAPAMPNGAKPHRMTLQEIGKLVSFG